jgi:16S rRNA (cytosine1402-N4)-methyltransferase
MITPSLGRGVVFQPVKPDMSDPTSTYHVPVLLRPVLEAARGARRAVDATLGDGGHAAALRDAGALVLGIDRDPDALGVSRARLGQSGMQYLLAAYDSPEALALVRQFTPDFILLDLGVCSRQLDETARGFTFRPGAPLDMRMAARGETAADFLNRADERTLETAFRDFGDERRARRLAAEIVRRRSRQSFATSDDLVNAVRATLGAKSGPSDFARLFQAVRIAVNRELEGLERALPNFRDALVTDGRLAIITYHSGEDRLVKQAFRAWARSCVCPPELPVCACRGRPLGRLEPRKPITPEESELALNPRARSAKLRTFVVGHAA